MLLADAINVCPPRPEVARYPHIAESLKLCRGGLGRSRRLRTGLGRNPRPAARRLTVRTASDGNTTICHVRGSPPRHKDGDRHATACRQLGTSRGSPAPPQKEKSNGNYHYQ